MAGVLLNSGDLQHYNAMGDEGQPVYSVATQLREAVRIKVGAAAADCLAIPRANEAHSTVDWYSAYDGMVVPWSAATDQERTQALQALDQFHQRMVSTAGSMDGVSDREKRIVQNLLGKVFHFPSRDCVFLVDGKPVLTFWGFQAGTEPPPRDPFFMLRPVAPVTPGVPPPIPAVLPVALASKGRPWWLWLLLLLLLAALLFWWLRGCSGPTVAPALGPMSGVVGSSGVTSPPDDLLRKDIALPTRDDATVDSGLVGTTQRWWRRVTGTEGTVDATGGTDLAGVAGAEQVPVQPTTGLGDGAAETATETAASESAANNEGAGAGENAGAPAGPEAPDPAMGQVPTPEAPTDAGQRAGAAADPGAGTPLPAGAAQLGTPMAIPPSAMQSGSVKFLDGNWRAAGGLQDSATGQPVRLQYQFQDGQAKVTVQRGGGVTCEGVADSSLAGGKLQISGQGTVAKCSDGSTFALPAVSCTPDQSGQARCVGVGADGRALPITIRQTP